MSSLRELALAHLRGAGQQPGQDAGQLLSRPAEFPETNRDSKNGGNLPQNEGCPGVPRPRDRDSGTVAEFPGQDAGQLAGQPGPVDYRLAAARYRGWRAGLAQVHSHRVPEGWTLNRWAALCDDAEFILDGFGEQAARDGWSTADLWGVWPNKPHYGGLADRLRGSRSLVMTADRACWRSWGRVEQFNRGAYPTLLPFWEALATQVNCAL